MSRAHAIKALLAHGPLNLEAMLAILGGDVELARVSLRELVNDRVVYSSRGFYTLRKVYTPAVRKPRDVRPAKPRVLRVPKPKKLHKRRERAWPARPEFALQSVWTSHGSITS